MILYLTFNDAPSGIYNGQVIDVVRFMKQRIGADIRLIAFISLRGFLENRKKIKALDASAVVVPMYPGLRNWRKNSFLFNAICKRFRPARVIGRSVMATQIALEAKRTGLTKSVVYDGRGAIAEEWKEYNVVKDHNLLNDIVDLEKEVIEQSDLRIAVSHQLKKYWKDTLKLEFGETLVIPCTIDAVFENAETGYEMDQKMAGSQTTMWVYSGSLAAWQSLQLLEQSVRPWLSASEKNHFLFLSYQNSEIEQLMKEFPHQVSCEFVPQNEVPKKLAACDLGILLREQSYTNKVASPVKFAEYLSCGLNIYISEEIGDFSEFVKKHKCGQVEGYENWNTFVPLSKAECRKLALTHFSKSAYIREYSILASKKFEKV